MPIRSGRPLADKLKSGPKPGPVGRGQHALHPPTLSPVVVKRLEPPLRLPVMVGYSSALLLPEEPLQAMYSDSVISVVVGY